MALTREYKQTVLSRIQRDPKFARALYAEALNALLEGEAAIGFLLPIWEKVRMRGRWYNDPITGCVIQGAA